MILPQKWYDLLKWVALVFLPAFSAFYYALAIVWGFPNPGGVVATIAALDALLGTLLGIGSNQYKKKEEAAAEAYLNSDERFDGTLTVIESDNSLINQIEMKTDPSRLAEKSELVLKVEQRDIPLPSPPLS